MKKYLECDVVRLFLSHDYTSVSEELQIYVFCIHHQLCTNEELSNCEQTAETPCSTVD